MAGVVELGETRAVINATVGDVEDCGSWNLENGGARKETDRRCLLVARWLGVVRRSISRILTIFQRKVKTPTPPELLAAIKLSLDALTKWFCVALQLNGAAPLPIQMMTIDGLLHIVAKQRRREREIFTFYESSVAKLTACKAGAGQAVNRGLSFTTSTASSRPRA